MSALLLLALLAAPLFAQEEPAPEAARTPPASSMGLVPSALVWVPREDVFDLEQLLGFLEQQPSVGLTVALSPAAFAYAEPDLLARIPARLEIALRLAGDPVLPLVTDLQGATGLTGTSLPSFARPGDVAARVAAVRMGYPELPRPPAGFVPGAGAMTPGLLPLLAPFQIRWTAVGTTPPAGPWTGPGGVVVLPLKPFGEPDGGPDGKPGAWVVDDTVAASPGGLQAVREAVEAAEGQGVAWLTVTDFLADPAVLPAPEAPAGAALSPWTGDYGPWTAQPLQRAAWDLLAKVARDVDAAQASAVVAPRKAEAAARELQNAENGRFFLALDRRVPASLREAAEREFRVTLQGVYRLLGTEAPDELQKPLGEAGPAEAEPAGAAPVETGEDWLVFRDRVGDGRSADPEALKTAGLEPSILDLESMRVGWQDGKVVFSVSLASGPVSAAMVDVYIDMNRRPGAGLAVLLPAREAAVETTDSWEFALELTAESARLYQSGPQGQLIELEKLPVAVNDFTRTLSVSVSSETFRGDPRLWGYVAGVMAAGPENESRDGMRFPLKGKDGSVLLDILSPWTADPATAVQRRRLEAVRTR